VSGPTALVDGRNVIHLCSNDYLGLSQNAEVIRKAAEALQEVSQCSSRLVAGNHPRIVELEATLADHRGTESVLVYPTGYSANLGLLTTIADKNSTIFSDELNHASIIDACRLSGARIAVFRHNDAKDLEELMRKSKGRKILVTEGIFSMDGDISKLREICAIARERGAITVVDDAHGDFICGPGFSGVPSMLNEKVDVHISSMSKGLGCFGGYVASDAQTRDLLVNTSRQFIYTSALPDHLCAAARSAIPLAKRGNLQSMLRENIHHLVTGMKRLGFLLGNSTSQIIPVLIGNERLALKFSEELLDSGVFAQAIRYPTVRKGAARLRLSVTAMLTADQIDEAVESFQRVGKRNNFV
jgi:glycine C-acetyltransferase